MPVETGRDSEPADLLPSMGIVSVPSASQLSALSVHAGNELCANSKTSVNGSMQKEKKLAKISAGDGL